MNALLTVVGVTGETGDNVVLHVVMGSTHAHALAPIPLRQVVGHNVPETAKKHGLAKTDHAMLMEGGVVGQTTASVVKPAVRERNINIVRAPIHHRQVTERTVTENRGRERNVERPHAKLMEVGVTGQITVNATRPVAGGGNINIVRVPIHPPQMAEKTVEEKRGRARNVNWLRAEEIKRKGILLDLTYNDLQDEQGFISRSTFFLFLGLLSVYKVAHREILKYRIIFVLIPDETGILAFSLVI